MAKILETKSLVNGGYIQLIRIRKTFRTELVEEDGWKIVRNHRFSDSALKRFSKFAHHPRPVTKEQAAASNLIRIPKHFYDDCVYCKFQVVPIERETEAHYWIDVSKDSDGLKELISRADSYADLEVSPVYKEYAKVVTSAKELLKALEGVSLQG
tara:strand:+ start:70 stop:534 length:465 start_codon:yes stop_codon:yes gene_type:complete